MMKYQTLVYPGIFEVVKNPQTRDFVLSYKNFKYQAPEKLYGGMDKYVDFYWRSFEKQGFKGGLLLTGQKGSGKTAISSILCNKAIDRGLRVIEVTNLNYSPELLRFLDDLDGVVLFFDEFGKNFNTIQQDKMLTLLSNINGRERLVFITENEPNRISPFIRNRPGRIRYSLHFNKLPLAVVEEYCEEKNVDKTFFKEFVDAYKSLITFQFDHLKAIVDEHLNNLGIPFEELVELLNVEDISGVKYLIPEIITEIKTDKLYKIASGSDTKFKLDNIEKGRVHYLSLEEIPEDVPSEDTKQENTQPNSFAPRYRRKNISFSKSAIVSMVDDQVVAEVEGFRLIFKIEKVKG